MMQPRAPASNAAGTPQGAHIADLVWGPATVATYGVPAATRCGQRLIASKAKPVNTAVAHR